MRRSDCLALLFFFLTCLFPGLCLLSRIFDYTLRVNNGLAFVILTTLCCYGAGALLLRQEGRLKTLPVVLLSCGAPRNSDTLDSSLDRLWLQDCAGLRGIPQFHLCC